MRLCNSGNREQGTGNDTVRKAGAISAPVVLGFPVPRSPFPLLVAKA